MSEKGIPGLRTGRAKSPFGSLLSMQMRLAYSGKGLAEKLGLGRKARNAYLYLLVLVAAFAPLVSLVYDTAEVIAAQSVAIGQPGLPVVMAVTAGQFFVFFMGISSVMSVLYYANDIETLLALPLTARQIMLAKLLVAYVAEIVISAVVAGPFLLALGLQAATPEYWLYAVLILATMSAVPVALSVLATVLIMRVTKGSRKRDQFRVVLGLLFFAMVLGVQYLSTSLATRGPDEMMRLLVERNGLVQVVAGYYPPLKWAAWALTADTAAARFGGLALFCGVSLGVLFVVATVSQRWFFAGLSAGVPATGASAEKPGRTAHSGSRGRTAGGEAGRVGAEAGQGAAQAGPDVSRFFLRARRPALAIALKDHLMLVRTPNFLLVALTNLTVFPLLAVMGSIGGQGNIPFLTGGVSGPALDTMTLILVGFHGLLVSGNQISSTAVTREGRTFWASKMIPVAPRDQIKGKLLYGLGVSALQLVILLVTSGLLLKVDGAHLAVIAVLGTLVSLPVTSICIMNDLRSPKLGWDDPHQAMKGNFGTMIAMLFSALYLVAVGFVVRLLLWSGLAAAGVYAATAVILAVSGIVLERAVESMAETRYRVIEA